MRKNIYKIMLSVIALVAFTTVAQAKTVVLENMVIGDILEPGDYIANYSSTKTVYTCSSFTAIDNYILDEEITYNPMVIGIAVGMLSDTKYCKLVAIDDVTYYFLSYIPATEYTITAIANNTDYGTVLGSGTYEENDPVTLTATPAPDYKFVNWTVNGEGVSTDNPYVFTATENIEITANNSTGIKGLNNSSKATIYPNPTTGKLTIENQESGVGKVTIYDTNGKKLTTLNTQSPTLEINLSNYANGTYFIETNKQIQKIIKQ